MKHIARIAPECWEPPPRPMGGVQTYDFSHPAVMPLSTTVTYTCPDNQVCHHIIIIIIMLSYASYYYHYSNKKNNLHNK